MTEPLWRNPKLYALLGFVLVAVPSLFFFFMGMPGTSVTETEYANGSRTVVTETVWKGAFNPFLLSFVIGAAVSVWGCYRSKLVAWVGSLFVLAYSILAMFSIGLLTLPGAVLLVTGAAFSRPPAKDNALILFLFNEPFPYLMHRHRWLLLLP